MSMPELSPVGTLERTEDDAEAVSIAASGGRRRNLSARMASAEAADSDDDGSEVMNASVMSSVTDK